MKKHSISGLLPLKIAKISKLMDNVSLTDLKIDLADQNQVLMILSQIPKLLLLNGKSTKEAVTIVDLDEKDIEDISLEKEVEIYNDILNKLNKKEENIKKNLKSYNDIDNGVDNDNNNNDNKNDSTIYLFSTEFQKKII